MQKVCTGDSPARELSNNGTDRKRHDRGTAVCPPVMPLIIVLLMNTLCEYNSVNTLCEYSLQILSANITLQKNKSALSTGLIAVYRSSSENFSLHFQEFDVEIEFFSRHLMI